MRLLVVADVGSSFEKQVRQAACPPNNAFIHQVLATACISITKCIVLEMSPLSFFFLCANALRLVLAVTKIQLKLRKPSHKTYQKSAHK